MTLARTPTGTGEVDVVAERTPTRDLVDAVTVEAGGHSIDELPDSAERYRRV